MKSVTIVLVAALLLVGSVSFAQTPYSQDFETLAMVDGSMSGDGWLVYGNVSDALGNYLYGHGPWPAPNNISNWCDITTGEGGVDQGEQQLSMFSDYNNTDHALGYLIESNLYREQVLPVGASGTWIFQFDAKMGDLTGASTALAFIKTLDPSAGYTLTNFIQYDTTSLPATWGTYTVSLDVTGLDNQLFQIGFAPNSNEKKPVAWSWFQDHDPKDGQGTAHGQLHPGTRGRGKFDRFPLSLNQGLHFFGSHER